MEARNFIFLSYNFNKRCAHESFLAKFSSLEWRKKNNKTFSFRKRMKKQCRSHTNKYLISSVESRFFYLWHFSFTVFRSFVPIFLTHSYFLLCFYCFSNQIGWILTGNRPQKIHMLHEVFAASPLSYDVAALDSIHFICRTTPTIYLATKCVPTSFSSGC